jgi:hypothetical protein
MLCVWGAYPIGYVPSTAWSCACCFCCQAKLASEVLTEAITLVISIWLKSWFPVMSLAKHFFAKLKVFHKNYTCLNHALALIWCASVQPVAWSLAARSCYQLLLLAGGDGLLLACPSPPGSAPGGLSFSSWTCCWLLVLLLLGLILSFSSSPWFYWMIS